MWRTTSGAVLCTAWQKSRIALTWVGANIPKKSFIIKKKIHAVWLDIVDTFTKSHEQYLKQLDTFL